MSFNPSEGRSIFEIIDQETLAVTSPDELVQDQSYFLRANLTQKDAQVLDLSSIARPELYFMDF